MRFRLPGCRHRRVSFPMAISESAVDNPTASVRPHVVCLDCGREFWYDWKKMRRLSARPVRVYRRDLDPRRVA